MHLSRGTLFYSGTIFNGYNFWSISNIKERLFYSGTIFDGYNFWRKLFLFSTVLITAYGILIYVCMQHMDCCRLPLVCLLLQIWNCKTRISACICFHNGHTVCGGKKVGAGTPCWHRWSCHSCWGNISTSSNSTTKKYCRTNERSKLTTLSLQQQSDKSLLSQFLTPCILCDYYSLDVILVPELNKIWRDDLLAEECWTFWDCRLDTRS